MGAFVYAGRMKLANIEPPGIAQALEDRRDGLDSHCLLLGTRGLIYGEDLAMQSVHWRRLPCPLALSFQPGLEAEWEEDRSECMGWHEFEWEIGHRTYPY